MLVLVLNTGGVKRGHLEENEGVGVAYVEISGAHQYNIISVDQPMVIAEILR